jgi:hypothetical protein
MSQFCHVHRREACVDRTERVGDIAYDFAALCVAASQSARQAPRRIFSPGVVASGLHLISMALTLGEIVLG